MPRHSSPPRDDVQRSERYTSKLIPSRVETVLNGRLTGMQSSYADWASHQEEIQARVAGVLSGFTVPSYRYSRWYAYAMAIDKVRRDFGDSPGTAAEIANITGLWIARGYDVNILDAIKISVLSADLSFDTDSGEYMQMPSVNAVTGHSAWASINVQKLWILDQIARTWRSANLTTAVAQASAWCPELGLVCLCELDTSDVVARVAESNLAVTEFPLSAGDHPEDLVVDYDKGYFWVCCSGHGKVYGVPLAGTGTPLSITVAHVMNHIVMDVTKNCLYATGKGNSTLYIIDRTTHAVTSYVAPGPISQLALDPTNGELWIAGDIGNNNVYKYNTTTHAFTTFPVSDSGAPIAVNPVLRKAYYPQSTPGNIIVIDGATGATTTIATSVNENVPVLDVLASSLLWADNVAGTVTRVNLVSGTAHTYALDHAYDIGIFSVGHLSYISRYVPGVSHLVTVLQP